MPSQEKFGLSVALATPFTAAGEIAEDALVAHARRCLENGCDGVTLFGTTGEGASISWRERRRILARFEAEGLAGEGLVSGISATSAEDAVAQIEAAQAMGCRRVLLPPPYYFKAPDDSGVLTWYGEVEARLDRGSVDIILYNIPALTGVPLGVDLVSRLRDRLGDAVIGVKDSSGDWPYTQALLAAHKDTAILVGEERHLAEAVRQGGSGAICGMANLDPAAVRLMACDGREQPHIDELVDLLEKYPLIPAIKAALAYQSGESDWSFVRAPLLPVGKEDRQQLEQNLAKLSGRRAA